MKLTRRQLRKLISEAMFAPDIALSQAIDSVRKHPDYGDDFADQIEELVNNDDPDVQRQGYDLLGSVRGKFHPSSDFESDILDSKKRIVGDIAEYLTNEQVGALESIIGLEIDLDVSSRDGVGVVVRPFLDNWHPGLYPKDLYEMILQIGNKTADLSGIDDLFSFDQSEVDPVEEVFRIIIELSERTYMSTSSMDGYGFGTADLDDNYELNPPFDQLEKDKKLIITPRKWLR